MSDYSPLELRVLASVASSRAISDRRVAAHVLARRMRVSYSRAAQLVDRFTPEHLAIADYTAIIGLAQEVTEANTKRQATKVINFGLLYVENALALALAQLHFESV